METKRPEMSPEKSKEQIVEEKKEVINTVLAALREKHKTEQSNMEKVMCDALTESLLSIDKNDLPLYDGRIAFPDKDTNSEEEQRKAERTWLNVSHMYMYSHEGESHLYPLLAQTLKSAATMENPDEIKKDIISYAREKSHPKPFVTSEELEEIFGTE